MVGLPFLCREEQDSQINKVHLFIYIHPIPFLEISLLSCQCSWQESTKSSVEPEWWQGTAALASAKNRMFVQMSMSLFQHVAVNLSNVLVKTH
jgi:hypothetical protein